MARYHEESLAEARSEMAGLCREWTQRTKTILAELATVLREQRSGWQPKAVLLHADLEFHTQHLAEELERAGAGKEGSKMREVALEIRRARGTDGRWHASRLNRAMYEGQVVVQSAFSLLQP